MFINLFCIENGMFLNSILKNELEDTILIIINFGVMLIY
jgi:hypothetical protein